MKLIIRHPCYASADLETDLRPKIQYLLSIGIERADLPEILPTNKAILSKDANHIVPTFDFVKQSLTSHKDLVDAIRFSGWLLGRNVSNYMVLNMIMMRAHGVPERLIRRLMSLRPSTLMVKPDRFEEAVKQSLTSHKDLVDAIRFLGWLLGRNVSKYMVPNMIMLRAHRVPDRLFRRLMSLRPSSLMVKPDWLVKQEEELGFKPWRVTFLLSVNAIAMTRKKTWDSKRELCLRLGWSKDEFFLAFRLQPMMMLCSEAKITKMMEFFGSMLGLEPSMTTKCPNLFLTSLRERIIARCFVLQVLMSNGLIEKPSRTVITAPNASKMNFIERYYAPFQVVCLM
ncbi:uncharacterized protein LOC116196902 [Punica granatum]|uniref:Uncharacterized protein LOC116196902 n=2 Tax=Punica granatum TaxID=22663 RepID=A0A6P8CS98_PUNGR|nr:uncharacterized protein LOC116196902 [Punica granatum]PKI39835.1 hypothetical protein CRG98_039768 [Punica granatum]